MSSATVISISNRALLSIGARAQISNLQEGSTESDAISTLFVPTFEQLARTADWNCLRKQATLSLIAAAQGTPENPQGTTLPLPPTPWLYSYALPSDCLQVRFLVPSFSAAAFNSISPAMVTAPTWINGGGEINYAVAYSTDSQNNPTNVILTNLSQAQAVYTVDQSNPVIWDSLFQQAMVASLSAYLVPALSLNLALMQASIKTAESIISQARVRDGDEGVTVVDHLPDWIAARGIGRFIGYGYTSGQNGSMCWPSC